MGEIVDFVENVLDADAKQIIRKIEEAPGQVLARKRYILDALQELWQPQMIEDFPKLAPGELRPVFSGGIESTSGRAVSRELVPGSGVIDEDARRRRLEIQSLLLYAHSVALHNPLLSRSRLTKGRGLESISIRREELSDRDFLVGIYSICDTAHLTRRGVLYYFDPILPAESAEYPLHELVGLIGRGLYSTYSLNVRDQGLWYRTALSLLEQTIFQLLSSSATIDHSTASLLIPTDMDASTFGQVAEAVRKELKLETNPVAPPYNVDETIRQLVRLSLPGVEGISLKDVVSIRDDESFSSFRLNIRAAIADSSREFDRGDTSGARAIVGEHMAAALSELQQSTRRGVLADAVMGDAVGWAVGATVAGAFAGWQGIAATLLGKAAAELVRKAPSKGRRALRNHYVALSDKRLPSVRSGAGLLADSSERLWGIEDKEAAQARLDARDSALDDIFGALEEGDD